MSYKKIVCFTFLLFIPFLASAHGDTEIDQKRRDSVEDATQALDGLSIEIGGEVGEVLKVLSQEQKNIQDSIESDLIEIEKRTSITRFFFGPNYRRINSADDKIVKLDQKIEEIKDVRRSILEKDISDSVHIQIHALIDSMDDLEDEVRSNRGGFSLFGWVNYLVNKYF